LKTQKNSLYLLKMQVKSSTQNKVPSVNLWGYDIHYASFEDFISHLEKKVKNGEVSTLLAMNTLKYHLGETQPHLKAVFQDFDHITCDGQSMVWALRLLKGIKTNHLSGVELMIQLISLANEKGYSVFFLGSPQSLLDKVKAKIDNEYPGIKKAGYQNGYYNVEKEEGDVIKKISEFRPDFLFVAFGSPRKEVFIQKYKEQSGAKVLMGVGGSYEVFVGEKKLDSLTKKLGLRWFVRMVQDPRRLFKRYLVCNSFFAGKIILSIFRKES
jgi:N-acetylglucosaminyldiphosphoundecaprenol N-acetyl-beta-D-mannosaminyltransferase